MPLEDQNYVTLYTKAYFLPPRKYSLLNWSDQSVNGVCGKTEIYCGLYNENMIWLCRQMQNILMVESSWNVMAHGEAREKKWRGNWRTDWVASTLHTTSEHGVSRITTADAHPSAASSRLNWRPCRFKWTRPFRRRTKSGFCACAITFQTQSTSG